MKRLQTGFTLIELVVVIGILAILALIVAVEFREIQPRARDTERKTDIVSVAAALERYYANNGEYPTYVQMRDSGPSLLKINKDLLISPTDNVSSGGNGASGNGTSIVALQFGGLSSEDTNRYKYWVPGEDNWPTIDTSKVRNTFVLGYLNEQGSYGEQGTRTYVCGKGNNVNTSKASINSDVVSGGARNTNQVTASSCSNF